MSKDNFATPLTRFFRVSACKATALHHLFQNKKLFNCLHKLSNGIDCAPKTALPAEISRQIYIFRDFLMQKYKPPRFATFTYLPDACTNLTY